MSQEIFLRSELKADEFNKLFKGYHWSKNDLNDQNNFSKGQKIVCMVQNYFAAE